MAQQLDPDAVLTPQRFLDYEQSVKRSAIVEAVLGLVTPHATLCDVGGASGVFADMVRQRSPAPIRANVLEVVAEYREKLVSPDIGFVHASIVDGPLPHERFDIVTARHVLHHLVGSTIADTAALQQRGLRRMLQLVKPGGHLVFQEQVLRVKPFSRAVYVMSRFAHRRSLNVRYFDTGTVVVSYMTPGEVDSIVRSMDDGIVVTAARLPRVVQWRWKLTILMAATVDVLYVIRRR